MEEHFSKNNGGNGVVDYFNYFYPNNTVDIDIAWRGDVAEEFLSESIKLYEFIIRNFPNSTICNVNKNFDEKYEIAVIDNNGKLIINIDIYRIKDNIAACVQRFHMNCVRQWFDGHNVYMMSECIGTLMSGINDHYKYMANNTNPMDCVLKYANRGYTTDRKSTRLNSSH